MSATPEAVLLGGQAGSVLVARSLGAAGVRVTALNKPDATIRWSRFCSEFVAVPGGDGVQERWLEWLVTRASPGAVVLPGNDDGIELVARNRARLTAAGLITVEGDDEVMLAMLDKRRTHELADAAGVPTPRAVAVSTEAELRAAAERIPYPCAIKPIHGHLFARQFPHEKLLMARDEAQLHEAWRRVAGRGLDLMLTELVPGEDHRLRSYYTYVDGDGRRLFSFTKRKLRQYPVGSGTGTYHLTDWDPAVAELGERFCSSAGVRGLAHVEFKLDSRDERLKLIECNNRFTLSLASVHAAGIDTGLITFNRLTGRPLPAIDGYRRGVRVWSPVEDARAFVEYRRRGELALGTWLRSLLHPLHFPVARWDDPLPTVATHLNKLGKLVKGSTRRAAIGD